MCRPVSSGRQPDRPPSRNLRAGRMDWTAASRLSGSSRGLAVSGEPLGELNCLDQAALVGDALADDVEGGAVIDRGADDRQPRVMFTPERSIHLPVAGSISKPSSFTGMCPWS